MDMETLMAQAQDLQTKISAAQDSLLKPLSTDELKAFLNDYYSIKNSGISSFLRKIVKRGAEEGQT